MIGKRPFEKETTYQAFTNKKEPLLVAEASPEVVVGTEKEETTVVIPPSPEPGAAESKTQA